MVSERIDDVIKITALAEEELCEYNDWGQVINLRFLVLSWVFALILIKSIFLSCNESPFSSEDEVADG